MASSSAQGRADRLGDLAEVVADRRRPSGAPIGSEPTADRGDPSAHGEIDAAESRIVLHNVVPPLVAHLGAP